MSHTGRSRAIRDTFNGSNPSEAPRAETSRKRRSRTPRDRGTTSLAIPGANFEERFSLETGVSFQQNEKGRPMAILFDPEEFMHFVEDAALSDDQALALLSSIWQLVVSFVDLGFGLDPAQAILGSQRGGAAPIASTATHGDP